jgi:hypothetical protein
MERRNSSNGRHHLSTDLRGSTWRILVNRAPGMLKCWNTRARVDKNERHKWCAVDIYVYIVGMRLQLYRVVSLPSAPPWSNINNEFNDDDCDDILISLWEGKRPDPQKESRRYYSSTVTSLQPRGRKNGKNNLQLQVQATFPPRLPHSHTEGLEGWKGSLVQWIYHKRLPNWWAYRSWPLTVPCKDLKRQKSIRDTRPFTMNNQNVSMN